MIYGNPDFYILLKQVIKDELRHDLYETTVEHAKNMSVHILGEKPVYLLEKNRPREDEETKMYRLDNYEPTTKAGADRAIKIVGKGFNPTLYSLVWKEKSPEAEDLEKYTLEYYPGCNSIINFNKDVILRKMLADPNGLVAIKPVDIPSDQSEKLEPITVVYGSSSIWYYDREHYLINTRVPGKEDKEQWYEFEYYDKNRYINFKARYDEPTKEIETVELMPPYLHNGGKIPVWFLGGESCSLDNGKVYYQSFFSAALPHWNLAVKHGSDLMASIIAHIFPQKYEVAEECAYSMELEGLRYSCNGGILRYPGAKGTHESMECPQCHGAGLVSVKGPLQTYLFNKEKLSNQDSPLSIAPVGYIDVPIDSTRFLDEYTDKMNQKAMASINMDIEEKIGENQSGVAKAIDRTAQNDTIYDIHARIWDVHTQNEYYFINMYRNGVAAAATGKDEGDQKYLPEINKPTKFDLLTTSELIFNFDVSKKSGLDRNILRTQAVGIIKSENGSSPDMKNYLIALIELDPLYAFESDDIDLGVSKGVIRKADWAIHNNIKNFVDRAMEEGKDFLTKKKSDQIKILGGYATELIDAEKPRIDEAASMAFDAQQQKFDNAA